MKNPQALCYNKFRLRTGDFLCAKVRNMCWKTGGSYMEKKKKSMKLRTRVIISFFIIILVPIVMCALTFYFFVGCKAKIIGEKYGLANATYRTISNNTLLLNAMTSEEYEIGYGKAGRNELSLCSECKTAEKTVVYRGARGWCYHLQWLGGAVVGGAGK